MKITLLLLLFTGCASYNFTKGNIPPSSLTRVQVGQKMSDLESYFGQPLLKENYMDYSALMVYASDYEVNDVIDCRNIEIRLDNHKGEFIVKEIKVLEGQQSAKKRCYGYLAESESNYNSSSNNWAAFLNEANNSLDQYQNTSSTRNISSGRKFCYYDENGGNPSCFNTLSECRNAVRIYRGGACTIE